MVPKGPGQGAVRSGATALLRQRYRQGRIPATDHWNAVASLLVSHRSVRAFTADEVSPEAVALGVAAAQSASTSQAIQPWSVIAVRDRGRIAKLAEASLGQKAFVMAAPLYLAWLVDLSRLADAIQEQGGDTTILHYLDPLVAGCIDTALAAQNAAAYFESIGLGIVFIGALRYMPELVVDALELPAHVLPVFGMCVGTPDPEADHEIKPRLPQELVLHEEVYRPGDPDLLRLYAQDVQAFRLERDMSLVDWRRYSAERFVALQERVERERLEDRLGELGFGRRR